MGTTEVIFIQQASGSHHEELLDLTRPIHKSYCERYRFEYWSVFADGMRDRSPHWNKISLMASAMEKGARYILWLDADCLIVDHSVNLLNGVPQEGDIGMVVHKLEPRHFNSGAIYMKRSWVGHQFLKHIWDAYDPLNLFPWRDQTDWHEKGTINRFNDSTSFIKEIDDKWNSTPGINDCDNPVVISFHGSKDKIPLMRQAIQNMESEHTACLNTPINL